MSIAEPDYQAALERARGPWFDSLPVEARELSASYRAMNPAGVAEWLRVHDLNGFGDAARPVRQPPLARIDWPALAANRRPLLLLTGDADLYLPPAVLRWAAPRFAGARAVVVPDAGHPVFLEAPEAFNRLTLDFFRDALSGRHEAERGPEDQMA